MSRIGKLPIAVPGAVKVSIDGTTVKVEGPKGKLEKKFHEDVAIELADGVINVTPAKGSRFARAMQGTARSIIASMVEGVQNGFVKNLNISGVGYAAALKGKILNLKLGFSHDIDYEIPEGVTITVTDNGTKVKVEGVDKHMVGQAAASIKLFSPIEPYKGKGVHIEGEHIIRKEGKTVA